jgi:hypothetical protein
MRTPDYKKRREELARGSGGEEWDFAVKLQREKGSALRNECEMFKMCLYFAVQYYMLPPRLPPLL